MGGTRLDRLRPAHIQKAMDGMTERGQSPASVVQARAALGSAMTTAVARGLVAVNPVRPGRPCSSCARSSRSRGAACGRFRSCSQRRPCAARSCSLFAGPCRRSRCPCSRAVGGLSGIPVCWQKCRRTSSTSCATGATASRSTPAPSPMPSSGWPRDRHPAGGPTPRCLPRCRHRDAGAQRPPPSRRPFSAMRRRASPCPPTST